MFDIVIWHIKNVKKLSIISNEIFTFLKCYSVNIFNNYIGINKIYSNYGC